MAAAVVLGDESIDSRVKGSATVKYFNDLCHMVMMYTDDLRVLEPQIPKLIAVTSAGSCCTS